MINRLSPPLRGKSGAFISLCERRACSGAGPLPSEERSKKDRHGAF